MATTARITADEFLARAEEDSFAQLIRGEVVAHVPTWRHQGIEGEIFFELTMWTRAASGRGAARTEVNVRVSDDDVFIPDVVWVAEANLPAPDAGYLASPPDLAVEVRSPSTWHYDIGDKRLRYEAAGLRELWLVDHFVNTVIVFRRSTPTAPSLDVSLEVTPPEPLTSPQLPGFSLDPAKLFA